VKAYCGGDDLLQSGETAFGDDETAGIVCERHHSQEPHNKRRRIEAEGKCGSGNCGGRNARGKKEAATAAKRTELRSKAKPVAVVTDAHARDKRQSHADMITVRNDYVIEVLKLGPESKECWVEGFRERCVRCACHRSDLRPGQI
jgi:hypothetical protein